MYFSRKNKTIYILHLFIYSTNISMIFYGERLFNIVYFLLTFHLCTWWKEKIQKSWIFDLCASGLELRVLADVTPNISTPSEHCLLTKVPFPGSIKWEMFVKRHNIYIKIVSTPTCINFWKILYPVQNLKLHMRYHIILWYLLFDLDYFQSFHWAIPVSFACDNVTVFFPFKTFDQILNRPTSSE